MSSTLGYMDKVFSMFETPCVYVFLQIHVRISRILNLFED